MSTGRKICAACNQNKPDDQFHGAICYDCRNEKRRQKRSQARKLKEAKSDDPEKVKNLMLQEMVELSKHIHKLDYAAIERSLDKINDLKDTCKNMKLVVDIKIPSEILRYWDSIKHVDLTFDHAVDQLIKHRNNPQFQESRNLDKETTDRYIDMMEDLQIKKNQYYTIYLALIDTRNSFIEPSQKIDRGVKCRMDIDRRAIIFDHNPLGLTTPNFATGAKNYIQLNKRNKMLFSGAVQAGIFEDLFSAII